MCSEGPVMAASDTFELEVGGVGGHGAMPQYTTDAIVTAAHLVTSMQTIISRNVDPLQTGVVTCGQINGGYSHNIIADKVTIRGTARSFTKEVQQTIKGRMSKLCCGMECCYGGSIGMNYSCKCSKRLCMFAAVLISNVLYVVLVLCTLLIMLHLDGYPATVNAYPEAVKLVRECASQIVGKERSSGVQKTMGAEDFSFFLEARPGAFIFVGAALPGDPRPHHKSVFDIDENAIMISASVMINIVRAKLF